MPVLRKKVEKDFTVIPNSLLQDKKLSCRDRGLLVWMLSQPCDWRFSKRGILAKMEQDGERSIQAAVKNLQKLGYLKITRGRREKGKLAETIWTVFDVPQLQNAVVEPLQQENPDCCSPQLRYPAMENAAYTKNGINKRETADPAFNGGGQPTGQIYYDTEVGEWRRRDA